jgi:hypothetical protein
MHPDFSHLRSALDAIVLGVEVKRSKHDLRLDGRPCVDEFLAALARHGYRAATVAATAVEPGRRVPAFYLEGTTAWFGWVFWERFTPRKQRKLFGSAARNSAGDWEVQIPPARSVTVYVNPELGADFDPDRPSAF